MNILAQELPLIPRSQVEFKTSQRKEKNSKSGFESVLQQATQNHSKLEKSKPFTINSDKKVNKKQQPSQAKEMDKISTSSERKAINVTHPDKTREKDGIEKDIIKKLEQLIGSSLEEWLQQMEITVWDLLQPVQFQQVLQQILDIEDPMELLMNEKAGKILKEFESQLTDLGLEFLPKDEKLNVQSSSEFTEVMSAMDLNSDLETLTSRLSAHTSIEEGPVVEIIRDDVLQQESKISFMSDKMGEETLLTKGNVMAEEEVLRPKQEAFLTSFISEMQSQMFSEQTQKIHEMDTTITTLADQRVKTDELIQQITTHMKIHMKPDVSELSLRLKPEYLGNMSLKLVSEKGLVTAQIIVDNQQVKGMIESQLHQLRQTLSEQGVKVEHVQVFLQQENSQHSQQQQQMKQQKSRKRVQQIIEKNMENEFLQEMPSEKRLSRIKLFADDKENQVDYSV